MLLYPELFPPPCLDCVYVLCYGVHPLDHSDYHHLVPPYLITPVLQVPGCVPGKGSKKIKKRVVKLVISVTLIFALSWLPIQLILFIKSFIIVDVTIVNISLQVIY